MFGQERSIYLPKLQSLLTLLNVWTREEHLFALIAKFVDILECLDKRETFAQITKFVDIRECLDKRETFIRINHKPARTLTELMIRNCNFNAIQASL